MDACRQLRSCMTLNCDCVQFSAGIPDQQGIGQGSLAIPTTSCTSGFPVSGGFLSVAVQGEIGS